MKNFASRALVYAGPEVKISATIASQARLTNRIYRHVWPELSATEMRDESPLGPQSYVLMQADTNFGGEPVLVFQQAPMDLSDMESSLAKIESLLSSQMDRQVMREILAEAFTRPSVDPTTGIDPADYMHGRFPVEVRMTAKEFTAGRITLYFENDNPGIFREIAGQVAKSSSEPSDPPAP
jgi:hypothetical protein